MEQLKKSNRLMRSTLINIMKSLLDYEMASMELETTEVQPVETVKIVNEPKVEELVSIDSNGEIKALKEEISVLQSDLSMVQNELQKRLAELESYKNAQTQSKAKQAKAIKEIVKKKDKVNVLDIYNMLFADDELAMFKSFEPLKLDLEVMDSEENSVSIKGELPVEQEEIEETSKGGTMFPIFKELKLDLNENVYEDNSVTLSVKDPEYKHITIHKGLSK